MKNYFKLISILLVQILLSVQSIYGLAFHTNMKLPIFKQKFEQDYNKIIENEEENTNQNSVNATQSILHKPIIASLKFLIKYKNLILAIISSIIIVKELDTFSVKAEKLLSCNEYQLLPNVFQPKCIDNSSNIVPSNYTTEFSCPPKDLVPLKLFRPLLSYKPNITEIIFKKNSKALQLCQQGKYEDALSIFDEIFEILEDQDDGKKYDANHLDKSEIDNWRVALKLAISKVNVLTNKFFTLINLGKKYKALETLTKALIIRNDMITQWTTGEIILGELSDCYFYNRIMYLLLKFWPRYVGIAVLSAVGTTAFISRKKINRELKKILKKIYKVDIVNINFENINFENIKIEEIEENSTIKFYKNKLEKQKSNEDKIKVLMEYFDKEFIKSEGNLTEMIKTYDGLEKLAEKVLSVFISLANFTLELDLKKDLAERIFIYIVCKIMISTNEFREFSKIAGILSDSTLDIYDKEFENKEKFLSEEWLFIFGELFKKVNSSDGIEYENNKISETFMDMGKFALDKGSFKFAYGFLQNAFNYNNKIFKKKFNEIKQIFESNFTEDKNKNNLIKYMGLNIIGYKTHKKKKEKRKYKNNAKNAFKTYFEENFKQTLTEYDLSKQKNSKILVKNIFKIINDVVFPSIPNEISEIIVEPVSILMIKKLINYNLNRTKLNEAITKLLTTRMDKTKKTEYLTEFHAIFKKNS